MVQIIRETIFIPEEPNQKFGCAGAIVIIVVVGFIIFKCSGDDAPKQKETEPTPIEQSVETLSPDEVPGDAIPATPATPSKSTALPQAKPRVVTQPVKEPEVEEPVPVIEHQSPETTSPKPEVSDREQRKADRKARRDARKTERDQRKQNQ